MIVPEEEILNKYGLPSVFWVDKRGNVLSGDTHTIQVINKILAKYNIEPITKKEFEEGVSKADWDEDKLREAGLSEEEIRTIKDRTLREYAIKNWDWIRCRLDRDYRGVCLVEARDYSRSVKRRLENILNVGAEIRLETLSGKNRVELL